MQLPASIIPSLTAISISGDDCSAFLDAQLSVNVSDLLVNQQQVAAWCNAKGQTIMVCLVQRLADNEYSLICEHSLKAPVLKRLQLFVLRAKVYLGDQQAPVCWFPPKTLDQLQPWEGLKVTDQFTTTNQDTIEQWYNLLIQSGFTWLNAATSQQFLPQMLALEKWQGLDYQKGCFPGQEVIARTHHLGRLKRHLWHVQLDAYVAPGNVVMQEQQTLGTIVECFNLATSQQNTAALAVLSNSVENLEKCYINTLNKGSIQLIKKNKIKI